MKTAPRPPSPVTLDRLLLARTEGALEAALGVAGAGRGCPPLLANALRHAVFPGGARLRPQVCLLAAVACGDGDPALADSAAAALELLHCASLVHDDLPCFDDAATRRGRPSVHKAYGEPLAVLAGDALIVMAFEVLARSAGETPPRAARLIRMLAAAAGPARGIVAGQAWESEPTVPLDEYHRAKTGALFEAAACMGAAAGGGDPLAWARFGELLGCAYQAADDVADLAASSVSLGKPAGRDAAMGRPNVAQTLGVAAASARWHGLVDRAIAAIPAGPGRTMVVGWVRRLAANLDARFEPPARASG